MFYFFVFCLIGCALSQAITEPIAITLPEPPAVQPSSSSFGTSEVVSNIRAVFSCQGRNYGYFADVDNNCTLFHVCHPTTAANGQPVIYHLSQFCPNNTRFSQNLLVCLLVDDPKLIPCGESVQYYPPTETRLTEIPVVTVENIQSFPEIAQRIEEIVSAQRQQPLSINETQNIPLNTSVQQRVGQQVEQPIQETVPVQTEQQFGEVRNEVPNQSSLTLQQTFAFVPSVPVQNQPQFQEFRNDVFQQSVPNEQRVSVQNQPQIANIQNIEPFQRTVLVQQTVPVQTQPQFPQIRNVESIQQQNIPINKQIVQPVQYTNERVVVSGVKTGNVRVAQPIRTFSVNSVPNILTRAQQAESSIQNNCQFQSDLSVIQTSNTPGTEPDLRAVVNTQYVPQPVQFYQRFYVPQVQRYNQPVPKQVVQPLQSVVQRFYRTIKQTPDVIRTGPIVEQEVGFKPINSEIVNV